MGIRDEGRVIAGRYRLIKRLGSGGMGVVWQATDEVLDRTVAVKELLLPPGMSPADTERARTRALREGRIAARLRHPNAVGIYDVTEHDDHPVLIMEYLPARSLAEVLERRRTLPEEEVAAIGAQAADALAAAHAAGITHRDVKPGNLLIGADGTVKITDFGVSRATGEVTVTATGMFAGTPLYLSPEVARGADPAPASDVFSLGATLYAAVEGRPPYADNANPIALLHEVASGAVIPLQRANRLDAALRAMLDPDADARPTMAEVHAMLAGAPVPGPSPGGTKVLPVAADRRTPTRTDITAVALPQQPTGERRRGARLALLALAVLVLTGVVVAVALSGGPDQPPGDTRAASPTTTQTRAVTGADLERAVAEYYALLPEDTDAGWARLGPGLRAQGKDVYARFWNEFRDVMVVDAPRASGDVVTVGVEFVVDGGDRVHEVHRLGMLAENETVLIDSDQLVSSRRISGGDEPDDADGRGKGDDDKGKDKGRNGRGRDGGDGGDDGD